MVLRIFWPVGDVGWSEISPVPGMREFPDLGIPQFLVWSPMCRKAVASLMDSSSQWQETWETGCPLPQLGAHHLQPLPSREMGDLPSSEHLVTENIPVKPDVSFVHPLI